MTPNGRQVGLLPYTRQSRPVFDRKSFVGFVCALAALALLWSWYEARQVRSARDSYHAMLEQTERMSRDVRRLSELRTIPRVAADRERPNSELLEQIRTSLEQAGIEADRWLRNDPSPSRRLQDSPYKQMETRLTFQDVALQRLVAMLHHLVDHDATLTVSQLRLSAPATDRHKGWHVDLTLSYLVYAPHETESIQPHERIGL